MRTRLFHIIYICARYAVLATWLAGVAAPAIAQDWLVGEADSVPAGKDGLIPLRVQMGEVDPTKLPVLVAMDAGIFKKNGLAVDLYVRPEERETTLRRNIVLPSHLFRSDPAPIIMFGGFWMNTVSAFAEQNPPDRVILATLSPFVHRKIVAVSAIKRLEDLKGKRIAYSDVGSENHAIGKILCQKMGWDPVFDVSLLRAPVDMITMRKGIVDAVIAPEVFEAVALSAGLGYHAVFDTTPWKIPIPGSGINTTRAWLRNNRDAARRYVKSIVEGIAVLKKDREAANRALAKWFNIYNPEHQRIIYDSTFDMDRKPYPSVEGIKLMMKLYDSLAMRKYKPEDFYDDSLVRELDESGFIDGLYNQR